MRKADNLPSSCAVVTKSGNLNFLETSGPLRACNGTALPLLLFYFFSFPFMCSFFLSFFLSFNLLILSEVPVPSFYHAINRHTVVVCNSGPCIQVKSFTFSQKTAASIFRVIVSYVSLFFISPIFVYPIPFLAFCVFLLIFFLLFFT